MGANRRTGKLVLEAALARDIGVTSVVRSKDKAPVLQHEKLRVMVGDPCDPVFLTSVFRDLDVVVSALGDRLPSKVTTSVYYRSGAAIVEAASVTGLKRVLVTSTDLQFSGQTLLGKLLRFVVPNVERSAGRMEEILKRSGLDWTSARVGFLNNTSGMTYRAQRGAFPENGTAVSRLALAHFLVDAIPDPLTHGAAYGVSQTRTRQKSSG